MTCPVCGGKTKVIGSKSDCESVHRRRMCDDCQHTFFTVEYEAESSNRYNELMREYGKKIHMKGGV